MAALVLPALVRLLNWTCRFRVVDGAERLQWLVEESPAVVLAGWHETLLTSSRFLIDRLIRHGFSLALLVSRSRDGEIMARFAAQLGVTTVRGSTSRGALEGLRKLYRLLTRGATSVGIAADGPRGPARVCKPGALLLAQLAGTAVVPIASAADRYWRIGSWDRMFVPKPFARIAVVVGEPIRVAPELDSDGLARASEDLARVLDELTDRAAAALA